MMKGGFLFFACGKTTVAINMTEFFASSTNEHLRYNTFCKNHMSGGSPEYFIKFT